MIVDVFFIDDFRWEIDYIRGLLWNHHCRNYFLSSSTLLSSAPDDVTDARIIVFSSNRTSSRNVSSLIHSIKPQVMIHLSDECGNNHEYIKLYQDVPVVLRQHYHPNYPQPANQTIIPLGFMTGMFVPPEPLTERHTTPITNRKYSWSFVGKLKHDRQDMLDEFQSMKPFFTNLNGLSPCAMAEVYGDSIFVPCGRGNIKLDCFRLYEATLCGALPVVVGSESECNELLFSQHNPPWIVARTWKEAFCKCREIRGDKHALESLQVSNLGWWDKRITYIRSVIDGALGCYKWHLQ
jgi:hypothetical protein